MSHTHDASAPEVGCIDFLEQIVYLIDNELSADDRVTVLAHIETCSPCLERYDLQRTVKAVVARSCCEVAPTALRDKIVVALTHARVEFDV